MADFYPHDPQEDALLEDARSYFAPPSEEEAQKPGEAGFEPDFGSAFDEYGDYDADAPQQVVSAPAALPKRRRHLKKFKFPALLKLAIYFVLVALLSVALARFIWAAADDVLGLTRPDQDVVITIEQSDTVDDIAVKLHEANAIRYEWLFKLYLKFTKSENYFDPGVYTVNLTCDYHALVNNLMATAGNRETVTIMVIEGSTCEEIFKLLEENGVCSREDLRLCAAEYHFNYSFLRRLPYGEANRLEGFLFPDTYEFYKMDEPENVLDRFLKNFEAKMDEDLMALVNESDYSLKEILTMASIIEGEAANDSERTLVASVMYNRLNHWDNPLLGMDSTVYYGAEQMDTIFDINLDSPYNTYRYPGLPKGPINNPGLNSIKAVLHPAESDYYYFATGVDGLNHFFTNEDDFNAFIASDEFRRQ